MRGSDRWCGGGRHFGKIELFDAGPLNEERELSEKS